MKCRPIVCACAILLGAGCTSTSRSDVERTYAKYALVQGHMTRPEVIALVGQPQSVDRTGVSHWNVTAADGREARLDLSFGKDDRVARYWRKIGHDAEAQPGRIEPGPAARPTPFNQGDTGNPLDPALYHAFPPLN